MPRPPSGMCPLPGCATISTPDEPRQHRRPAPPAGRLAQHQRAQHGREDRHGEADRRRLRERQQQDARRRSAPSPISPIDAAQHVRAASAASAASRAPARPRRRRRPAAPRRTGGRTGSRRAPRRALSASLMSRFITANSATEVRRSADGGEDAVVCSRMRLVGAYAPPSAARAQRLRRVTGSRRERLSATPMIKHALPVTREAGFRRLVSGRHRRGRSGRGIGRARLHGDPAVGLWHLGAHPAAARRPDQGDGARELLFPAVHPALLFREGGRACRGLRQGDGGGHAPPADRRRQGRADARSRARSWRSRWSCGRRRRR